MRLGIAETVDQQSLWDAAKLGDPIESLPEPAGYVCEEHDPWTDKFVCCRAGGHRGQHVAVARRAGVVATWPEAPGTEEVEGS